MARIPLTSGFQIIPEGSYVFKVTKVEYEEEFSKLKLTFSTKDGQSIREQFVFVKQDGTPNDGACNAFSYLAKTLLQRSDMQDVDPDELMGRFIRAEVTHQQVNGRTYAHLGDKVECDGFDGGDDLDDMLD